MISLLQFVNSRRTQGTKHQYRQSLCLFFECLSGTKYEGYSRSADHVARMDELSLEYLKSEQDHISNLLQFITYLSGYAPNPKNLHLTTVILWLDLNDISLKKSQIQFLKSSIEKRRVQTQDHILTHDEIKRWYEHLSRIGRVALMMQLSSGMRIGEVLGLEPEDVDIEDGIVYVRRSNAGRTTTKNQKERVTFLSNEAIFALKEWLEYRDTWVHQSSRRWMGKHRNMGDTRIIPASNNTIQVVYTNGLEKAGLLERDPNTGWATITSHSIRKFFHSQLKTVMPAEMVEALMGHEGYLSGSYRRYSVDQLKKEYDKAYYAISLHSAENLPEIKAERESMSHSLQYLMSDNIKKESEIQQLNAKLEKIERIQSDMQKITQALKDRGELDN
jgi:integrase